MTAFAVVLYNLAVLAGTAYLVAIHNWSPWWFLFTLLIMLSYKNKGD